MLRNMSSEKIKRLLSANLKGFKFVEIYESKGLNNNPKEGSLCIQFEELLNKAESLLEKNDLIFVYSADGNGILSLLATLLLESFSYEYVFEYRPEPSNKRERVAEVGKAELS